MKFLAMIFILLEIGSLFEFGEGFSIDSNSKEVSESLNLELLKAKAVDDNKQQQQQQQQLLLQVQQQQHQIENKTDIKEINKTFERNFRSLDSLELDGIKVRKTSPNGGKSLHSVTGIINRDKYLKPPIIIFEEEKHPDQTHQGSINVPIENKNTYFKISYPGDSHESRYGVPFIGNLHYGLGGSGEFFSAEDVRNQNKNNFINKNKDSNSVPVNSAVFFISSDDDKFDSNEHYDSGEHSLPHVHSQSNHGIPLPAVRKVPHLINQEISFPVHQDVSRLAHRGTRLHLNQVIPSSINHRNHQFNGGQHFIPNHGVPLPPNREILHQPQFQQSGNSNYFTPQVNLQPPIPTIISTPNLHGPSEDLLPPGERPKLFIKQNSFEDNQQNIPVNIPNHPLLDNHGQHIDSSEIKSRFGGIFRPKHRFGNRFSDSAVRRYNTRHQIIRTNKPKIQASYNYGYNIQSEKSSHSHHEARKGNRVEGVYHVDLPNGFRQIVRYYADETGYHPTVTYIPIPRLPFSKIVSGSLASDSKESVVSIKPSGVFHPPHRRGKELSPDSESSYSSPEVIVSSASTDGKVTLTAKDVRKERTKSTEAYGPPPRTQPTIHPDFIRKSSKPLDTESFIKIIK